MLSNSQAEDPPERSLNSLSVLVGAVIALMTLVMPLYIVAAYSSGPNSVNSTQRTPS